MVEDEDTLRLAASNLLTKNGFSVLSAADGQEAVDLFCSCADDIGLILLDVILPGISGPQVLREIRRVKPNVKIVLTSAYNWEKLAADFSLSREDVSGFIRKPYGIGELLKTLRQALNQE